MPPELVELFRDAPLVVLFIFLAAPFLVLIGVVTTAVVQRLNGKSTHNVAQAGVAVSETEAETHQFQAIIDGFTQSLAAVSKRAESAESQSEIAKATAEAAESKANELSQRVRSLEDERHDAITHVLLLEALIPYPPGPPSRPAWMRQFLTRPPDPDRSKEWAPEEGKDSPT